MSEINLNYSSSVNSSYDTYKSQDATKTNTTTKADATTATKPDTTKTETKAEGVVYESTNIKNMSESERAALVEKLKADAESRVSQLKSLVEKLFLQQSEKATTATGDIWKFLASGEYTVDAETQAAAKEAISEDGYWGVEQTSQRIFDMAVALSGGDDAQMDKMLKAFEKGFKQATETWGKELPDISQKTYAAVQEKFANYKNEQTKAAETDATTAQKPYNQSPEGIAYDALRFFIPTTASNITTEYSSIFLSPREVA